MVHLWSSGDDLQRNEKSQANPIWFRAHSSSENLRQNSKRDELFKNKELCAETCNHIETANAGQGFYN